MGDSGDDGPPTYDFEFVILGGGTVAGYAAREFVNQNDGMPLPEGFLGIISEENVCPYERPALSKGFLVGAAKLPGFHTCAAEGDPKPPSWYEQNNISVVLGARVSHVDFASRTLSLGQHGFYVRYGKLLLGTGASCAELQSTTGADLPGIYYMRSIADAEKLVNGLNEIRGQHAVVVGGGYIAMEAAAALISTGACQLTIVHRAPHLLKRMWTEQIATMYEKFLIARGAKIIPNVEVAAFRADSFGDINVVLKNREDIKGRLVLVGVGAKVDNALYSELEMCDGWVKVDSFMRTSAPDVYAAGDLISFPMSRYSRRSSMNEKTVTHARRSAECAVRHMLGRLEPPYDLIPYSYSRIFNLAWHFFGDARGRCYLTVPPDCKPEEGVSIRFIALWIGDDRRARGIMVEGCSAEEQAKARRASRVAPLMDLQALKNASEAGDVETIFNMLDDIWLDSFRSGFDTGPTSKKHAAPKHAATTPK